MTAQPDPTQFKKSGARLTLPNGGKTLSSRLHYLASHHNQRASTWWAAAVEKLVEPAVALERKAKNNLYVGFVIGLISGLALAFYLGAF